MSYATSAPSSSSPPIDDTPWLVLIYGTVAGSVILCGFCFCALCSSWASLSRRFPLDTTPNASMETALIPVEPAVTQSDNNNNNYYYVRKWMEYLINNTEETEENQKQPELRIVQ